MKPGVRRASAAAALLVTLAAALPSGVLAARLWTVAASPTTVYVSTPVTIRLTVTNIGGSGGGDEISCIQVAVPSSFTISSVGVVSVYGQTSGAAHDAWVAVWPGGSTVAFKEPADDYPLVGSSPPNDEAVFRIAGTSTSLAAMTWTASAFDHSDGKAATTACGGGAFLPVAIPFVVLPLPTPAPTATPTPPPTPAPTATPTGTPTPPPTPKPTPAPTPTAAPTPPPTPGPGVTPGPSPSASPSPSAAPDASAVPSATPAPAGSPTPSPPGPTPAPPTDAGTGGFAIGGGDGGSNDAAGPPAQGIDGAVISMLEDLPGGLLPFAGPVAVLTVPGLLVIVVVAAQALGALAWLPLARRKLGGFGLGPGGQRSRRSP